MCLLQVDSVPVAASLVVYWLNVHSAAGEPVGDGDLLLGLQDELQPPTGASPEPGFSLDLARVAAGPVLRRTREDRVEYDDAEPVPSLAADYWVERPDGNGVVQLAFATPMVELREGLLELFDAVVTSLHWVRGQDQGAADPTGSAAIDER